MLAFIKITAVRRPCWQGDLVELAHHQAGLGAQEVSVKRVQDALHHKNLGAFWPEFHPNRDLDDTQQLKQAARYKPAKINKIAATNQLDLLSKWLVF